MKERIVTESDINNLYLQFKQDYPFRVPDRRVQSQVDGTQETFITTGINLLLKIQNKQLTTPLENLAKDIHDVQLYVFANDDSTLQHYINNKYVRQQIPFLEKITYIYSRQPDNPSIIIPTSLVESADYQPWTVLKQITAIAIIHEYLKNPDLENFEDQLSKNIQNGIKQLHRATNRLHFFTYESHMNILFQ